MLTVWRWAIEVFQWVVWLYLYSFCFGFTTLHVDTNRWKLKPCRVYESMNEKERERKKNIKTQVDQNHPARASRFAPFSRMRWRRVLVYEWGCGGWAAWCVDRSSKPRQASAVKMNLRAQSVFRRWRGVAFHAVGATFCWCAVFLDVQWICNILDVVWYDLLSSNSICRVLMAVTNAFWVACWTCWKFSYQAQHAWSICTLHCLVKK